MRIKLIFLSLCATVALWSSISAQTIDQSSGTHTFVAHIAVLPDSNRHVRVSGRITAVASDPSDPSVGRGAWNLLSFDTTTPTVIPAGKTIRLRIASTNNRGQMSSEGIFVFTRPVGCEGEAGSGSSRSVIGADASSRLTVSGVVGDSVLFDWRTKPSWKGGCQMLVIARPNGEEFRTKLRLQ